MLKKYSQNNLLINTIPFIFVFFWSTGFITAKFALPFIEPFYLLFIRMLWTLVIFFALAVILRVTWPNPKQAGQQMLSGFLIHGLYLGGVFAAIKWGLPAGLTAIIVGAQPLLTALLSWSLLGERLKFKQYTGLALGFIGVLTIITVTQGYDNVSLSWPALFSAMVALFAIAVGTLYQKRYGMGVNLVAASFWQYLSTALLMGTLAFTFESRVVIWDIQLIWALIWLIVGLSVAAILLLLFMIREGESAKVASYFYLVPPLTSIQAWILFDETLPLTAILAIFLVVFGVFLVVKREQVHQ